MKFFRIFSIGSKWNNVKKAERLNFKLLSLEKDVNQFLTHKSKKDFDKSTEKNHLAIKLIHYLNKNSDALEEMKQDYQSMKYVESCCSIFMITYRDYFNLLTSDNEDDYELIIHHRMNSRLVDMKNMAKIYKRNINMLTNTEDKFQVLLKQLSL